MAYEITNQRDLRRVFWEENPNLIRSKLFGDYAVDTRITFVEWIDALCRNGRISEAPGPTRDTLKRNNLSPISLCEVAKV